MALRLLQIVLPKRYDLEVLEVIGRRPGSTLWSEPASDDRVRVSLVLPKEECDDLVSKLDDQYASVEGFRLILEAIEATRPAIAEPKPEPEKDESDKEETPRLRAFFGGRVASDELIGEVSAGAMPSRVFFAMVVLSTVVAAAGLVQNSAAVIIGAMVIAPLLGPNLALSLSLTLGDVKLARKALMTNLMGVAVAASLSMAVGVYAQVSAGPDDPATSELFARTVPRASDIAIALGAGAAGTLAATTGVPATLVGVMVAVALLPPLVSFGLLLVSPNATFAQAIGALMLTATNVICINLSAMAMFRLQGVKPRTVYATRLARKGSTYAMGFWGLLLGMLAAIIIAWPSLLEQLPGGREHRRDTEEVQAAEQGRPVQPQSDSEPDVDG
ncbi:MAG: TIGR00341 family protein [Phycisphaerales bacterium JB060]